MNKEAIVEQVATSTHTTKRDTAAIITACLDAIMQAVQRGDVVTLRGLGRFERRERQARLGRNPRTGDVIPIPARATPTFTASRMLRWSVHDVPPPA